MKKIIALAIVCAMTVQGTAGILASDEIRTDSSDRAAEKIFEETVAAAEPGIDDNADNTEQTENTEEAEEQNNEKPSDDTTEGEDSKEPDGDTQSNEAEETESPEEPKPTEAPTEENEEITYSTKATAAVFAAPAVNSAAGTGSYSFDNAAEVSDWTSTYAKISWDSTVDASENDGGSLKFEYDIKSGGSGDNIKMTIPSRKFCGDLKDGECYTLQFKVYAERAQSGANTYINITTTDIYKNTYYPIASAVSEKYTISKNTWKTVTLDYVHNPTTGNIEIVFPNGLSKQKDSENYDIYYIDDIRIVKNDTIAPYAEKKDWFKPYDGSGILIVSPKKLDISETSSLMQTGDTQDIVLYEASGEMGDTTSEITRTKVSLNNYTFTSEYPEIAEVDENGTITALSGGYTVITATTGAGANQKTAKLLLTVVDNIDDKANYIIDEPNNYVGRVEDFTGMRDYVYMTFCQRTSDENSYPGVSVDVKTPHIATFTLYDTGTADIDMDMQYGKMANRMFEGGGSNRWYNTSYRWLQVPGVASYVTQGRNEGWHSVSVIIDYPTEHSAADGYMSKTIYVDGNKIGSGDFDCSSYSGKLSFWFSKNQLVKEAYVVPCGTDFKIKSITPNISGGKLSDVNSSIVFEFSNNINPETIVGNISLADDVQNIPFAYDADGKKLTITPEYPLDTEKEYTLTLKKDMAAIAKGASVPGNLDTDRKYRFSTDEYPVTYKVDRVLSNKIRVTFTNNSNTDRDVYYVITVYKNKAAQSVTVSEGSISAKGTSTITATTAVDKISECDGYEICVFARENGKPGELLNNVLSNTFSGISTETNIAPKNETSITAGYDPEKELVEITGQSKSKRMQLPVILKMYKKDSDGSTEAYKRAEVIRTGKNGEINYSFAMHENAEKCAYKIVLTIPFEDSDCEREINYIDIDDAKAYLAQIDKQTTAKGVSSTDIFNSGLDPFRILDENFEKFANKDFIYNSILQNKPYASGAENAVSYFKSVYRHALEIGLALEGETADCVNEIKENHADGFWGIADNNAYKTFVQSFGETQQTAVIKKLKSSQGYKNIGDIFNAAVIAEDILSQTSYSTIYSVLNQYNDIHNISYSVYNGLTESKKLAASESFYKAVKSAENSLTIAELKETFEKCASDEAKKSNGGNGGNNGGSTGGSTGGNKSTGSDIIFKNGNNTGKVPDWYEDDSKAADMKIFDDLDNAKWAEYSINKLYNLGAISGKAERIFAPNDEIKREELCRIIASAFKLTAKENAEQMTFSDVEQGKWYTEYIEICYQNRVINGIGDNLFGVGRTVTREEISTILVRAAEASGKSLDYYFTIFPFPDADEISEWAKQSVSILHECLIVIGLEDGRFAPKDNVTRAQAAKMIAGLLDFNY